jgi:hypothetical protein
MALTAVHTNTTNAFLWQTLGQADSQFKKVLSSVNSAPGLTQTVPVTGAEDSKKENGLERTLSLIA